MKTANTRRRAKVILKPKATALAVRPSSQLDPVKSEAMQTLHIIERMASDPKVDVTKLERLVAMHERARAQQAEQAFNVAMSGAQHRMQAIGTNATNKATSSRYATYAKLDKALRPIYTELGFGLSFDTLDSPVAEHVRVACYVTHIAGHARTYRADIPADGKGAKGGDVMTKTHAVGSALSYGMRYLLKMIFNVAIGEHDDDGNKAARVMEPAGSHSDSDEPITAAQANRMRQIIRTTGRTNREVVAWLSAVYQVSDAGQITQRDYETIIAAIERPGAMQLPAES